MAFSGEVYARVRESLARRRQEAFHESERRKSALYDDIQELVEIDAQLSLTGPRLFYRAIEGGDVEKNVEEMRRFNGELRRRRAALLTAHGYSPDYTDVRFQCETCHDTGFTDDNRMCACMRRELILAGYESSGLAPLLDVETFDTFSLDYYAGPERVNMEHNVKLLRDFAEHFGDRMGDSFLLIGATGLGKTHLSTATARVVLDGGYDVCYVTAHEFFNTMELVHFRGGDYSLEDRFLQCELLIIDDLGTELKSTFTVSCLYNVVNGRINARRSTIINTNLTSQELRERYEDRITSRLLGEFRPLLFVGKDVRAQKLKRGN